MQSAVYVSLSSQLALDHRMSTVAGNMANMNTTGFRGTEVKFAEVLDQVAGGSDTSYVNQGKDFLHTDSGGLTETGNPLDFAVKGDAWFLVDGPAGPMLSRDGRFASNDQGELINIHGHQVLDAGGGPIPFDAALGELKAGADGSLTQNGQPIGSLGLFQADLSLGFQRIGDSGILSVDQPQAIVDTHGIGVHQGYLEGSNVDAVLEMANLISVSRSFENVTTVLQDLNETIKQAIQTIGGGR